MVAKQKFLWTSGNSSFQAQPRSCNLKTSYHEREESFLSHNENMAAFFRLTREEPCKQDQGCSCATNEDFRANLSTRHPKNCRPTSLCSVFACCPERDKVLFSHEAEQQVLFQFEDCKCMPEFAFINHFPCSLKPPNNKNPLDTILPKSRCPSKPMLNWGGQGKG